MHLKELKTKFSEKRENLICCKPGAEPDKRWGSDQPRWEMISRMGGGDGMRGDVISGVLFCYRLFHKLKIIFLKRFSLHALQSLKNLISRHSLNVAGSILLLLPFLCQTNFRKERGGGPQILDSFSRSTRAFMEYLCKLVCPSARKIWITYIQACMPHE